MSNQSVQAKRGLQLDQVVLLGRTFEEYRRYFLLEPHELDRERVLDVAGGVSSFCAKANNLGIKVTAFDPIYSLSREKISERPRNAGVAGRLCQTPVFVAAVSDRTTDISALRERCYRSSGCMPPGVLSPSLR
jgi:hypothetical protein